MSEQNQRINSRLNKNNRKKKTNTILNVLIGVVLLLIIIVAVNLVTDDKDEKDIAQEQKETVSDTESSESEEEVPEDIELTTEEIAEEDEENESASEENDSTSTTEPSTSTDSSNEITEESDDPNVEAVLVDPSWGPLGTSQTGEHVSSYTKGTVDWEEKVDALAHAANLDPSNMIVQFLGNGGSPQKSIGTVTSKDGKEIYRISLEWVDGQGWKPTKKEKLKSVK